MKIARTRTRLDTDERRGQLIARGRELFSKRPYDEISIDDIAEAVGVSKGLLYHYFDSKRRFYVETVRATLEEMRDVTEPDPTLSPLEQLEASLDRYLDYIERHGSAYETLIRRGIGSDPEVEALVEEERLVVIHRVLRGLGLAEAPPLVRISLRAWLGLVDAACIDWMEHRDVDRNAVRSLLTTSLEAVLVVAAQSTPAMTLPESVIARTSTSPAAHAAQALARRTAPR